MTCRNGSCGGGGGLSVGAWLIIAMLMVIGLAVSGVLPSHRSDNWEYNDGY